MFVIKAGESLAEGIGSSRKKSLFVAIESPQILAG
jgi:hypothetical protein